MRWLLAAHLISLLKSKNFIYLYNNFSFREELFNNIQKGVLKIPASLSEECKNLIVSLLNRNPAKRLGAGPDGCQEIKDHPYFEPMDWNVAKAK